MKTKPTTAARKASPASPGSALRLPGRLVRPGDRIFGRTVTDSVEYTHHEQLVTGEGLAVTLSKWDDYEVLRPNVAISCEGGHMK